MNAAELDERDGYAEIEYVLWLDLPEWMDVPRMEGIPGEDFPDFTL